MRPCLVTAWLVLMAFAHGAVAAEKTAFNSGPLLTGYGPVARVKDAPALPPDSQFKVAFDVAAAAAPGELNRALVSAARFLNMHAAHGVPAENLHLALVIHGGAVFDVASDAVRAKKSLGENANTELLAELQRHGVRIQVCGQSAAHHGVAAADLLPGVQMALSAMTAHALLQQAGYTLNPF